jgi:hypothetical protein
MFSMVCPVLTDSSGRELMWWESVLGLG